MNKTCPNFLLFGSFLLLISCSPEQQQARKRGAIVFGDSSTIVTETDPQYLRDNVEDLVALIAERKDSIASAPPPIQEDLAKTDTPANNPAPEENTAESAMRIHAPFAGADIQLLGVSGRQGQDVDWQTSRGVAYTLTEGSLDNTVLKITGAKNLEVEQRVETILLLTNEGRKVHLSTMSSSWTDWKTLKPTSAGEFKIKNLGSKDWVYDSRFSSSKLQRAFNRFARQNRMSKGDERSLSAQIRKVRSYKQSPISIGLSTVVWRVSFTDTKGHTLRKEFRIDIPR